MSENSKKHLFTVIKIVIGISLLVALLIWNDTGSKFLQIISEFRWEYIFALMLLGVVMNFVSSMKWELFLKDRGMHIPITRLFNLYVVGIFFNNFMPSMVGGDLTRVYLLGRQIESHSKSAASVFLERFTGLLAMILMAITFSLFNIQILGEPIIGISVGVIIIGCIALLTILIKPSLVDVITAKLQFIRPTRKFFSLLKQLLEDVRFFKNRYKLLTYAMIYSFIFHLLTSVSILICCYTIGLYPSFLDIAVITPIILLVTAIPVSPNNIGWWEWTFSVLLVHAGAGVAEGFTVALILRTTTFIFSLYGGLIFLFEKSHQTKLDRLNVNRKPKEAC